MTGDQLRPAHVRLREGVVFRELPFCGVLFDKRRARVFRLSQRDTIVLRNALRRAAVPGATVIPPHDLDLADMGAAASVRLLQPLRIVGLIRIASDDQAEQ